MINGLSSRTFGQLWVSLKDTLYKFQKFLFSSDRQYLSPYQVWSEFGHPILCRSFCRVLHLYVDTSSFSILLVQPLSACYGLFAILPCFISPYKYAHCHGNPVCFSSQVLHIIENSTSKHILNYIHQVCFLDFLPFFC